MEAKTEIRKQQYLLHGAAMLFAIAGAVALGFAAGHGSSVSAAAVQDQALVSPIKEPAAPCINEKPNADLQPVRYVVPENRLDALPAMGPSREPERKPEQEPSAAMPETLATRGTDAIVRWRGPETTALRFLEAGLARDALAWLVTADIDVGKRANLKGRALVALKDFVNAQAAFQTQVGLHNEAGSDAIFGKALSLARGEVTAIPGEALEDLLDGSVQSWGCAMAAMEYARRVESGLMEDAHFDKQRVQEVRAKGKGEQLARYYYQQALLSQRLLLNDEHACLNRLQDLTAKTILDPHCNHLGFGLPDAQFHKVVPGDSLTAIARQYEVTIGSICRLNRLDPNGVLLAGKTLKVVRGEVSLFVDRERLTATLLINHAFLMQAPVGIGPDDKTPTGCFTVRTKIIKPDWYYAGKRYPYGAPENILGTRWLGFDKQENNGLGAGLGLHGTTIPDSVPGRESLGCVRFHNDDVEFVYDFLAQGGRVEIR